MADAPRYLQWDIWQVEWVHEDGTSKDRPALLISTTQHNDKHDELWFLKITGRRHNVPYVWELAPSDPAYVGAGLKKTSYFYIADTRKIHKSQIRYRRGSLNPFAAMLIDLQIREATGWSPP